MVWKCSTMLAWILIGYICLAHGRKGFENPMLDAGTLTFIAMARDNVHHIANPVNIHGKVPAASIIARTPSPPPVDFLEEPYIPALQTNFSVYLTHDKPFDVSVFYAGGGYRPQGKLCFFLNLNIPSYPEAPDFRVKRNSAVVVENADFKRLARKVEDQRRRMAEGDLPTLEELNELPSGFYPLKDLSERCVKSSPTGAGHVVSCDVEVDYPLRLFGSPIPLIDLTVVSDSNRANVSEIVEQMKTGMEHGLEMVRRFGPPFPPMMPPFAQPPPPPPPAAAAVSFTAPFPGTSRTDNSDNNNRYADNNRNTQQTQAQANQWRPFGSQARQPGNQWVSQKQGAPGNMPMRAY